MTRRARHASHGVWRRQFRGAGLPVMLLVSACQLLDSLPFEIKPPKPPIRMAPLKHEVTLQPSSGMGPAPFKIDQAQAGPTEVKLTMSNPSASPIRVIWADGTFISADSITYSIGVKGDAGQTGGPSTGPSTIDAKKQVQLTVIAITKDGKPVVHSGKSMEPPYRVGLKLKVETAEKIWTGTMWVFVS